MKKYVLVSIMLATLSLICMNVSANNAVNVHTKDGKSTMFAFVDEPVVTYIDSTMVLTTKSCKVEFPLGEIDRMDFCEIEDPSQVIKVESAYEDVFVYDMNGNLLKRFESSSDEDIKFRMSEFEKQVLIIRQGNLSYKIVVE